MAELGHHRRQGRQIAAEEAVDVVLDQRDA
jgi:hypothetical protein